MSDASTDKQPKAGWNPIIGIIFGLAMFFVAQVVAVALLYLYPTLQGWSDQRAAEWLGSSLLAQASYLFLADGLIVAAVLLYIRRHQGGFRAIGLRRPRLADLPYGVILIVPYYLTLLLATKAIGFLVPAFDPNQKQVTGFDGAHGSQLLVVFFCLVILPPIAEEILVRGLLYSSFKKTMSAIAAAVSASFLFGIAHLSGGGDSGLLYIAAVDTFILSLYLIYLREKTGALWSGMILHAIKNAIAFFAVFVYQVT